MSLADAKLLVEDIFHNWLRSKKKKSFRNPTRRFCSCQEYGANDKIPPRSAISFSEEKAGKPEGRNN